MTADEYGTPSPDAPDELSTFAFLIGRWHGEGQFQGEPYEMSWVGRYILGGLAIADEAHVRDAGGSVGRIFITYRCVWGQRQSTAWTDCSPLMPLSATVRPASKWPSCPPCASLQQSS